MTTTPLTAHRATRNHQQGSVLIVSLIILVLLSLLGVLGMDTSITELLMTGNTQYQTTALSNAESTLKEGETAVVAMATAGTGFPADTIGYYDRRATGSYTDVTGLAWDGTDSIAPDGGNPDARYIIEYVGAKAKTGESEDIKHQTECKAASCVYLFHLTARSLETRGAVRLIQSIYVSESSP